MSESSKNLLYLLPDVAYAVELMQNKDGNGYVVRDFLQVNGEFMDENVILPESVAKLVGKLQPQGYDLILPDFLFTNTVVNVQKTGDEAVKQYIQDELIPSLEISQESHSVQAFVLTEFKGTSKVQLSALEKSLLDPIRAVFQGGDAPSVKNIYPLSWTLKSLISLEPSISIVQMGANLYLAQHYIGVDQANEASAEDAEKLVETVKTLKGAEPSIQTLYLLSSALVESKLKDGLKDTLPLQQLADDSEESEMPSYVRQIVEASAKTLSVADYKVPVFIMEAGSIPASKAVMPAQEETMEETKDEVIEKLEAVEEEDELIEAEELAEPAEPADLPTPAEATEPELKFADEPEAEESEEDEIDEPIDEPVVASTPITPPAPAPIDLSQFSSREGVDEPAETVAPAPVKKAKSVTPAVPAAPVAAPTKPVIKNEPGTNNMVRMIFIGLASFFVTVGIGLGIGLGLLTFTQKDADTNPAPLVETTPTPEPTVEPTPAVEFVRADQQVLVVNATTRAGYAGQIATRLRTAGFTDVDAQNATGDYETGNYLLMDTSDQSIVDLLSEDTQLDLVMGEEKTVEDPDGEYSIVIVLAE